MSSEMVGMLGMGIAGMLIPRMDNSSAIRSEIPKSSKLIPSEIVGMDGMGIAGKLIPGTVNVGIGGRSKPISKLMLMVMVGIDGIGIAGMLIPGIAINGNEQAEITTP